MSDSSDSDDDPCTTPGDDSVSCGHESHGDEGGNALFVSLHLTRQIRGSVRKQRKRAAGERRTRRPQDPPAGSCAACPPDLYYLVDAEGGSRGYRLVAAGVEAGSPPTHPGGDRDESDDGLPLWARVVIICTFLAVVGIVLIYERVGYFQAPPRGYGNTCLVKC
ncbi:hypothetical protein LY76DRAFT_610556 [Colletotrichum caudatum]|nr:hypothetical protein LY76DRAFT_610556 [Colletotrichum caudatum]